MLWEFDAKLKGFFARGCTEEARALVKKMAARGFQATNK